MILNPPEQQVIPRYRFTHKIGRDYLLAKMVRHARWILPLPNLTQQVEIMHIEGKEAGVLGMLSVGSIPWPLNDRRAMACLDLCQIPLNSSTDTILREQRVPSAGILEAFLAPQAEPQSAAMVDLIAHMLHQQEEVAQVVGVLDSGPKIRLQQGAEGRLSLGLPQPFHIADRLRRFPGQEDGQAMLPAEPV